MHIRTPFLLSASLLAGLWAPAPALADGINAAAQERAAHIVQTGIYYYWNGGDLKQAEKDYFQGITLKGRYDIVENSFREAAKLQPDRLDLLFGVASAQVLQKDTAGALQTWADIWQKDRQGFEAPILQAAYLTALENTEATDKILATLARSHPERTQAYQDKFARATRTLALPIRTTPNPDMPQAQHAIVVLGYALGKGGVVQPTLLKRLDKALALARLYPDAPLVLSGGVQQGGITEAYAMAEWLAAQGIARSRLVLEDLAKDTVGNAVNCAAILKDLGVRHATLVSSASHIRRGLTVLEEATRNQGLDLHFDSLVELDYPRLEDAEKITAAERVVVYRDLMRTSGIWAFPGIQQ
ncbi:ElyC/SanA/YdcF family protein [Rhodoferax sp. WC2427]|uniref:ElyC/SanA/YdcF family protein n=1 Tax=Rhodoferax sp. WC2427 TaxID=3234144 RepID=UPI0034650832